MAKLEIELSDGTIERLRQLAAARRSSIGDVVTGLVDGASVEPRIPGWGVLADEPELADALDAHMQETRRRMTMPVRR